MSVPTNPWLQNEPLVRPASQLELDLEFHATPGMVIMVPKSPMDFPPSCHSHDAYEFFIAVASSANLAVEGKKVWLDDGRILPVNAGQEHGTIEHLTGMRFLIIKVDRQMVQSLARAVYKSSSLEFSNQTGLLTKALSNLVSMFINENTLRQPGYQVVMQQLSDQIMIHLFRQLEHNMVMPRVERPRTHRPGIERVIDLINESYTTNLSLEEMARVANLSPFHFIRVFKTETGKTPYEYLIDVKIDRACHLLKNKRDSVTEVAYQSGFSNPSHFSKVFKSRMGVSPNRYQDDFK